MDIDYSKYYYKNDLILLRMPKESDWEALVYNQFDSEGRFLFNEEIEMPTNIEIFKKQYLEGLESDKKDYICFVIENSEGNHVGIANLFNVNERSGNFGPIGLQINPNYRHKGYGLSALRMLGKYMFNERRMHKWNSGYIESNQASANLHKKLGFEIEGIQKDIHFHQGKYFNQVICGMTETQFFKNESVR